MATLKEHQAAMVDLLANGSGIPASASRLAHAMHDLLGVVMLQSSARENAVDINYAINALRDATTPGLNDKALSKPQKALKTDSSAKWPTPAEQRVKELENTIKQLKANNAKLKQELKITKEHRDQLDSLLPEQSGCCKPDTQVCEHIWDYDFAKARTACAICGAAQ